MHLSSRPLYANPGDGELFAVPPGWDALVRYAQAGYNVVLRGRAGSGKTTTLHRVSLLLDNPTYVDATAVADAAALIEQVRGAITGPPAGLTESVRQLGYVGKVMLRQGQPGSDTPYSVEVLRSLAGGQRVVLLDATASAAAAYGLFGRLRDELWQLDLRWVVAIDSDEADTLLRPPASSFFDAVISLDPWPETSLRDLLARRGTTLSPGEITDIVQVSNENPRAALSLARRFLVESPIAIDVQFRRQEAAAKVGRSASMALAELEDLRAASASDARLLDRLGWSRERATQVLGELERARIVTSRIVRQERGRPRKVYAPNEMY